MTSPKQGDKPCAGARCYLAGPMRGYPEFNFPAFFAAAKNLREAGYKVWNPAENDVHQDGFDPAKDAAQPMRHYMKRDLPAVLDADFVAVLHGWEKSQGAMCEVTVARACGIPVLKATTLEPVEESVRSAVRLGTLPEDLPELLREAADSVQGSIADSQDGPCVPLRSYRIELEQRLRAMRVAISAIAASTREKGQ